ncbi:MAG TPA: protein TolR [Candidatus Acidoferrum sp.]|nr:protein TolR [Candidatus Acidoferrum sp.]
MEVNRRQRRKPLAEINVVPMIDVMLVLLIVFMITTPLITQGVKVDLPKVDTKAVDKNDKPTLVVSIDKGGKYYISLGKETQDNPPAVPLEEIGDKVGKIVNQNPGVPVFIEADGSISYSVVMNLLGTLQAAGANGVQLITQPTGGKK